MSDDQTLYLRGDLYYNTHKTSVFSILETRSPIIESKFRKLNSYYFFPYKEFVNSLFMISPSLPSEEIPATLQRLLEIAKNKCLKTKPRIVIPDTPFKLPINLSEALIGGIYRESWRILYNPLLTDPVPDQQTLKKIVRFIPDRSWTDYKTMILVLYGLLEDIRIISLGIEDFPNTEQKVHVLWEYIAKNDLLDSETPFPIKTIFYILRDLWLGNKNSETYEELMKIYEDKFPQLLEIAKSLEDLVKSVFRCRDGWSTVKATFEIYYDLEMWFGNKPKKREEEEVKEETSEKTEEERKEESDDQPEQEEKSTETDAEQSLEAKDKADSPTKEGEIKEGEEELEKNEQGGVSNEELSDLKVSPSDDMLDQLGNLKEIFGVEDFIEKTYEELNSETRHLNPDEKVWEKSLPTRYNLVKESKDNVSVNYIESAWIEIKERCNFLINSLRRKIQSTTMNQYLDGMPRGSIISDQYIVDTAIDLKSNIQPMRAYRQKSETKEISTASVILLDMSASMRDNSEWLIQVTLLLAWFLDRIGAKYSVIGFRNGISSGSMDFEPIVSFFQYKDFSISFSNLKINLSSLPSKLNGGTPTSDAVKLGIDNLEYRLETRKILFVVTDGKPNTSDQFKQTKFLCKKGKSQGILTVGIGIGNEALPVSKLFENSAWAKQSKDINKEVFKVLNKIL